MKAAQGPRDSFFTMTDHGLVKELYNYTLEGYGKGS